jgi:hypothetical protein
MGLCMPNPWVPLRGPQLILSDKVVDENVQLEKGLDKEKSIIHALCKVEHGGVV